MGSALGASSAASQGPASTTGRCTCRDPPRRASFFSTSTRPRLAPAPSPPTSAGATTPHCRELSAKKRTGSKSYAQTSSSAGTWTSATTIDVEREAPGTTTASPKDPPASKSPTSAQAVEECRECLDSSCTSSEPEADPEPRASQAMPTDGHRRTAGGTGLHTSGCSTAPSAPSTAVTPGEGAGPVAAAGDEEVEDVNDSQRPSGRPTGAAGTATGAGRLADVTVTPRGGDASSGGPPGDAGGAASANGTSTSSPTESTPTGSGGKSSSWNRFTGVTAAPEHSAA
ncbi:protein SPT2 homolog [Procambarus clarkii]|uniref:protein SPT2 homolog n=1 Tax=Procambarus clarkii TaxID=6728 RepID=UPI0037426FB2